MKLISNLDVNGNKFINGELTLQMPANLTGAQTIATLKDLEQFGGAFQFKGSAKSINEAMTIITLNDDTTVTASGHEGNVYQIGDKEYASNGSVWVELGFNIDLSEYDKTAAAQAREATLDGKITTNATAISGLDGRLTTAEGDIDALEGRMDTAEGDIDALETNVTNLQNDLEEAEEVTAAALNDLDSRATGLASRMTAAEGAIETLDGGAVKKVAIGSNEISPVSGTVTLPAATNSADGYMTATDHIKLSGIEDNAQVNIIEGVKLDGAADVLPLTSKVATIPNASANGNGLMTALDFSKLAGIAPGAEVNVQADWSVTDTTSDAYIANKPTNLAATYLYEPTTEQYAAKTVTIAATAHKCGLFPLVQVYYGMDVVSANVSVVVNQSNHDVTVSWEVAADSNNPIHIRIVG